MGITLERGAGRRRNGDLATRPDGAAAPTVASVLMPALESLLGGLPPLRIELWDGSVVKPPAAVATLRATNADALRRMLWSPGELGLARAYVTGDLEVDGDLLDVYAELREWIHARRIDRADAVRTAITLARQLALIGRPPRPPAEEARVHGRRHTRHRDAQAVRHHYDVGNDFYRLVLGPTMTYSCARFVDETTTLEEAQDAKHDLICRKLGLAERPGSRLLDVGCGWGSMAIAAATRHGARVVGITISPEQASLARERVAAAGSADRVEIRLQDYRDLGDEQFDAISSIGMSEHVGRARLDAYFRTLRRALRPTGRLLNHAISSVGGSPLRSDSFAGRYVFPDGELIDIGTSVLAMERAGFEVRDVESLREHYARTLRHWLANLDRHWDEVTALVGAARARIWRLYMTGSAVGFADGSIAIHQALGVVAGPQGESAMPPTRRAWG